MAPSSIRRVAVSSALAAALTGAASIASVPQEGWPQWRGPRATGEAFGTEPPLKWSETEGVKWKVKVPGRGTGTPIVWKDRIYLQTAIPTGKKGPGDAAPRPAGGGGFGGEPAPNELFQFALICLDRATGKSLWQKVAREELPHEGHHRDHGFASFSPVTDGARLYLSFGSRGVHCFDLDGNLKWSKDLGRMRTRNGFGEGSSPALHGDTVVVNWDHEGADFIVALDKATGAERWRQLRDEPTTWATPLIVEHGGRAQAVVPGTNRVKSYDLETGKLVWEHAGLTTNVIPSAVSSNGMVYTMSGFRGNRALAIRLGREGDLTGTDAVAWSIDRLTPYVPSPLLSGDRLYLFSGNTNVLSCYDVKTGNALISGERIEGLGGVYASPVSAAGRVYLVGRNGVTVVIKDAAKLEVLATNTLAERFDASPAVVGKELYLRGQEYLYCLTAP